MGLRDTLRGLFGGRKTARDWVRDVSGRDLVWSDHGMLDVSDGRWSASDASDGDSFDWLRPLITEGSNFAGWADIPATNERLFLFTTRSDGSYEAVRLLDNRGDLSGILVDIMGRTGDLKYLDKLLPATAPA